LPDTLSVTCQPLDDVADPGLAGRCAGQDGAHEGLVVGDRAIEASNSRLTSGSQSLLAEARR
jgi:hypothetical protein